MWSKIAMINITTRKPAALNPEKFEGCVNTLASLEKIIHRNLYTQHKALLPYPPTYYIELHAYNIDKDTGTIEIILIKSHAHLESIEIQYRVTDKKTSFFTTGGVVISRWEEIITTLLSSIVR